MDAAIRKAKDSIGNMFDKNLHDLVRGIRNHKENEAKYIAECIDEIKLELKQDNMAVKANAINKLCYLEMLGYDISWAAFNIIEVMSSTKFTYKRIGYLAASQSFHEGTDVLMLTTNMIRKDLGSQNMYEAGIALSGLSCFLSADLARDLANEIMTLMTSSKPYIRKKAVLIMYKIFLKYPDALRPAFPRLKEKLDDPEPSVQAAAVNVICELARKNPKNYLSLAPIFFKLMTVSTNNWVLIKIIKLFGALTPLEPRLGKKLIEPLTNLINSTSAMSLLYECINTVLAVLVSIASGQPNHNSAIEICLQKLRILIEDSDQNLKYLGLLAMSKILQTNPKSVQTHKDLIMQCLDDKDESIRLRSLDLLYGMVSKKNLMEIIKKLMVHMNKAEGSHYRDELLAKIVDICSQNNYQHVTNFEWYVSVLVELTRMEGTRHGKLLSSQMLDVAIRVETIRPFIVAQMSILLNNIHVFTSTNTASSIANNSSGASTKLSNSDVCEVLYAATWICGEFAVHLNEPKTTLESMLKAKIVNLPGHIQSAFVQNIFKLYTHIIHQIYEKSKSSNEDENDDDDYVNLSQAELEEFKKLTEFVNEKLLVFEQNADIEVQERACCMLQLLKYVQKIIEKHQTHADNVLDQEFTRHKIPRIDVELISLFEGDLNPVAAKAQRKVPVPEGLNLDEWINEEPSDLEDNEDQVVSNENQIFLKNEYKNSQKLNFTSLSSNNLGNNYGGSSSSYNMATVSVGAKKIQPELSQEEISKYKESRKLQIDSNPYYIKSSSGVKKSESNSLIGSSTSSQMSKHVGGSASESIRSQSIDLKIPLSIPGVTSSEKYYRMTQIDYENKKLKKKMKNKIDRKKQNKRLNEEEEDDDLDEPVVKVLSNEMPEGVLDDSGDEAKKMDPNDPHRALDINLDEPLRESEKVPVPVHRKADTSKLETKPSEKEEKAKEKSKKKSSKEKSAASKDDDTSKKDKKKKKKSKDTEQAAFKADLLTLNDDDDDDDNLNKNKAGDYNELLSPEQDNMSLANSVTHSPSNSKLNNKKNEARSEPPQTSKTSKDDDLEFWLSNEPTSQAKVNEEEIAKHEEESSKKSKKSKSKSKDASDETSSKKEKKKKEKKNDPQPTNTEELSNLKVNGNVTKTKSFQQLASNKHLKIKYQVEPNLLNLNQLIVKLRLKNVATSNSQINSIELIILDAANLKLIRNDSNETVKIPFSLSSSGENSLELLFTATDSTFQQKLKGTLTYMFKSEDGTIDHEKIDFKLNVPCSKYLVKNKSDSDDFNKWITSGQLTSKASIKLDSLNYDEINPILDLLSSNFVFTIVEIIDNNASLFTSTIQNHPICLLLKYSSGKNLSIEAKSTNESLIENLLDEFKSVLKA